MTTAVDPQLHALTPRYEAIFDPNYAELYKQHIVGRRLAHDMTIEEYRQAPGISSFGLAKGPDVGPITKFKIPVTKPAGEIELHLYKPKHFQQGDKRPIYINYHGGGWVIGAAGDDETWLKNCVDRLGCIAVDVDYRCGPEFRYPVAIDDSYEAFQWVHDNALQLGGDPEKIALGGFSAGGHLSAVVAIKARDAGVSGICFQLLGIPVTDASCLNPDLTVKEDSAHHSWIDHHDCPFLSHARMTWFYDYWLPTPRTSELLQEPLLSPLLTKSLANLPPALVVPAQVDVLSSEGIAYAKRLAAENNAFTELWVAHNVPHPFVHQYLATERAVEFREKALGRLKQAFNGDLSKKEFVSNA